ncbi:MAG: tRNA lysidine(34) synthetase TilS [Thermodesulfobacteriota bacterium]|nr:tRNA lysidine(34) synthetase TilS [Thermodesulfobacteriota bacterium]
MENLLAMAIRDHGLIPDHGRVLVAVSGGVDSVCLLHGLLSLSRGGRLFELVVAHLDHGLRQESSDDACFVASLCADWGVLCHTERIDVQALATQRKQGLEETGRDVRYQFLRRVAQSAGCDCVALAHHQGDQAETVMLRMVRGCGVSGLAAMDWRRGLFIRPLLDVGRGQIEAYRRKHALRFVEDVSNADVTFSRNRIRHQVMPELCQINPEVAGQFSQLSQRVRLEESYWMEQVQTVLDKIARWKSAELRLSCELLMLEHPALRVRVIRECLNRVRGGLLGIEAQHLRLVEGLLGVGRPQRQLDLPKVWVARRYGDLVFRSSPPAGCSAFNLQLFAPGCYALPGGRVLEVVLVDSPGDESPWQVEFDAALVTFPLTVRSPHAGDRIRCGGMEGRKKLKALFADGRVELEQRASALVLELDDELLWLMGVRRCRDYRVSAATLHVLRASVSEVDM